MLFTRLIFNQEPPNSSFIGFWFLLGKLLSVFSTAILSAYFELNLVSDSARDSKSSGANYDSGKFHQS